MSRNAWLTPDNAPTNTKCWRVFIPEGEIYEAAMRGALLMLTEAENWEQHGAQTPEVVAQAFLEAWYQTSEMQEC